MCIKQRTKSWERRKRTVSWTQTDSGDRLSTSTLNRYWTEEKCFFIDYPERKHGFMKLTPPEAGTTSSHSTSHNDRLLREEQSDSAEGAREKKVWFHLRASRDAQQVKPQLDRVTTPAECLDQFRPGLTTCLSLHLDSSKTRSEQKGAIFGLNQVEQKMCLRVVRLGMEESGRYRVRRGMFGQSAYWP